MKHIHSKSIIVPIILALGLFAAICEQEFAFEKKGTRTIYLIRHGYYDDQNQKIPEADRELVPLGIAQARLLAARLKSMQIKFSSLTSSTMIRAKQTAMILNEEFPELELQQSQLICECTPPTWRKDIMAGIDSTELSECVENLEKAFQDFFIHSPDEEDRYDLIVCHGNVIRYFVTKVLKVDTMAWLQMSIGNCSITVVRISSDGSMKLASFSDVGHIPDNMQTYTGGNNDRKELKIQSKK